MIVNDPTSSTVLWESPDGAIYEFRYIVTQTEAEGPERLEFRHYGDITDLDPEQQWTAWPELPTDQGEPPKEVMEHFHGKLIEAGESIWGFKPRYNPPTKPFALVNEYWNRMIETGLVNIDWPPYSGIPTDPDDLFPSTSMVQQMTLHAIETELLIITKGEGEIKSTEDWKYEVDGMILLDFIEKNEVMVIFDEWGKPLPDWAMRQLYVAAHNAAKRVAKALFTILSI